MAHVVSIRISDEMWRELRQQATRRRMKPSAVARDLVRRGLGVASARDSLSQEARLEARAELNEHLAAFIRGDS